MTLNIKNKVQPTTIRELRDMNVDTQPVGQRLPVSVMSRNGLSKSESIVQSIFDGIQIGMITIMKINKKKVQIVDGNHRLTAEEFDFESVDGGHRKRAIISYLNNDLIVDGKKFRQLSKEEQEAFLDIKLSFCYYNYLSNEMKGRIFRTLNETTDVNFIEMVNSYGDIPVANLIREIARLVPQIENSFHELFSFSLSKKDDKAIFQYLNFDNDRLKIDHMVARICYRYYTSGSLLLGGSSDTDIETMYMDNNITKEVADNLKLKLDDHFNFLRIMSQYRKIAFKKGLSQHDFKVLSYLYFYISDNYGTVNLKDAQGFYRAFGKANFALLNKEGTYKDVPHTPSGYTVPIMYSKYIGAPGHSGKIKMAMTYLIKEIGDIETYLDIRDTKRSFTTLEKEAKLAEQEFVCAVDGKKLSMKDAQAAHMISHKDGGKTIYSNLVMVRAIYNQEMGTMDFDLYMQARLKAA